MFLVSKKELVLYLLRAFFLGGFIGFSYLLSGFFRLAFQRIAGRRRKLFYRIGCALYGRFRGVIATHCVQ